MKVSIIFLYGNKKGVKISGDYSLSKLKNIIYNYLKLETPLKEIAIFPLAEEIKKDWSYRLDYHRQTGRWIIYVVRPDENIYPSHVYTQLGAALNCFEKLVRGGIKNETAGEDKR